MKRFLRHLIVYFLVSYFVFGIYGGVVLPSNIIYLIATLFLLVIAISMASPVLKFIAVSENFLTIFVVSSLLSFGMLYLLKMFMVGFSIEEYEFSGLAMGTVVVNSFIMSPIVSMVCISLTASFVISILSLLEKSE